MSLRNRHRQERRRRVAVRLLKASLLGGVLITTAFYAYHVGVFVTQEEIARLVHEVQRASIEASRLSGDLARTQAALAQAERDSAHFQALYDSTRPDPKTTALMQLVQQRLSSGLPQTRLMLAIEAAAEPTRCGETASKRLPVQVEGHGGDTVRFGEGSAALVVSAEGTIAMTKDGRPQGWYDPTKPVTVHFKPANGRASDVTGTLPLQHTVVTHQYEHRFTIKSDNRGLIRLSGDRCAFRAG